MHKVDIKIIGEQNKGLSDDALYKCVYKSLGIRGKLNSRITPVYIQENVQLKSLIYHPFWVVKNLIVAERPPFSPKKIPRIIFIDAVSGYRGLFSHVPPLSDECIEENHLIEPYIDTEETASKYIKDVQDRQINKGYVLKKPKHEVKEVLLVYLPIWKVKVTSSEVNDIFYINNNTGESEQFLSTRWAGRHDLL